MYMSKKRALVLSGGGARGAYQAGVWKALRKLRIRYDIVTGTSVGALNGVLFVQNDYYKCMRLWRNMHFDKIYDEPFPEKVDSLSDMAEIYKKYAIRFFQAGGMKTDKLSDIIDDLYNARKFRRSFVDYGLVTYNVTANKPMEILKKDMTDQMLCDFLVASASCYPAFQKKKIGDNEYVDGGYYDVLPINMAIDMGATEVIAVDLKAVGRHQKVKNSKIPIHYIYPKNKIVSFLVFDEELSRKTIDFGYNDTMKSYGKLDGDVFTFKKNHLRRNFHNNGDEFYHFVKDFFDVNQKDKTIFDQILKISVFHKIIDSKNAHDIKVIMDQTLERLGKAFHLEESEIYDIEHYHGLLIYHFMHLEPVNIDLIEQKIKDKKIKQLINSKYVVKYIYDKLIVRPYKPKVRKDLCGIACLFPKEFLMAIYMVVINQDI